jgi:hypothetical protein
MVNLYCPDVIPYLLGVGVWVLNGYGIGVEEMHICS